MSVSIDGRAVWDAGRWLFAAGAFVAGCRHRRARLEPTNFLDGEGYFEDTQFPTEEGAKLISIRAGVPLTAPIAFRIASNSTAFVPLVVGSGPSSPWRHAVDVSCEDPKLRDVLESNAAASEAITGLLAEGAVSISADGDTLWVRRRSSDLVDTPVLRWLFRLRDALTEVAGAVKTSSRRFRTKSIVLTGAQWFFIAFALTNMIQMLFDDADLHVDFFHFLSVGIVVDVLLVAILAGVFFALFGRSLDFPSTLGRTAMLLTLGVAAAGGQITSDANRYLDSSQSMLVAKQIIGLEAKRRHTDTVFDVFLSPRCYLIVAPAATDPVRLPEKIQVPMSTCLQARIGQYVELELGKGRLGLPWYRHIMPR